jgi:hypothetical protein
LTDIFLVAAMVKKCFQFESMHGNYSALKKKTITGVAKTYLFFITR